MAPAEQEVQMHRYLINFVRTDGKVQNPPPRTVEAISREKVAEAACLNLAKEVTLSDGRDVEIGYAMDENTGEIFGCAWIVTRVPSDAGKGAYRTAGELARKPSDRGGSTRKHRSPKPFNAAPRKLAEIGGRPTLVPAGGCFPNRAELAAAQRELAAAGLGTLNGQGFGTAVMVNPEHYAGIREVKSASSAPLAILAQRITPASDSTIAQRLASRPRSERIGGGEAAPKPR
jgi:hypothetical protein